MKREISGRTQREMLNEYGGLWEDAEIEEKVAAFSTEKDKKFIFKVQLCLR